MSQDDLLSLGVDVRLYRQIQRIRLAVGERIRSYEQGRSQRYVDRDRALHKALLILEKGSKEEKKKGLLRTIEMQIKGARANEDGPAMLPHPLWSTWLKYVRGVGPLGLAQLIGEIAPVNVSKNRRARKEWEEEVKKQRKEGIPEDALPPEPIDLPTGIAVFTTVSKLWKFAGLAPGQKKVKGEAISYNVRLKTVCCNSIGDCIIRANGSYRVIYDNTKARYEQTRPEWTKLHRHYAARRKMVKIFLSHFWEKWRLLEGLPIRAAYVHEVLGHTTVHKWQHFVETDFEDEEGSEDLDVAA